MSSIAKTKSLDHLVLTVRDLGATVKFYEDVMGMKHTSFTSGNTQRHALGFGTQKINLHESGKEFEPKAQVCQCSTAITKCCFDLCRMCNPEAETCAS